MYHKNTTGKWLLVVLDRDGKLLTQVPEPMHIPTVGMSVTTSSGFFAIHEVSISYVDQSVICYSEDYDLN